MTDKQKAEAYRRLLISIADTMEEDRFLVKVAAQIRRSIMTIEEVS